MGALSIGKKRTPKGPSKRTYIRRLFTSQPTLLLFIDSGKYRFLHFK